MMGWILPKKVFIDNSFKMPLFNDVMGKELINAAEWLRTQPTYPLGEQLINDIVFVITEIVKLNTKLLSGRKFSDVVDIYSDCSHFFNRWYAAVNKDIEISDTSYVCSKEYINNETEEYLFVMQQNMSYMSELFYSPNSYSKEYRYCLFLHVFFLRLYAGNRFFKK